MKDAQTCSFSFSLEAPCRCRPGFAPKGIIGDVCVHGACLAVVSEACLGDEALALRATATAHMGKTSVFGQGRAQLRGAGPCPPSSFFLKSLLLRALGAGAETCGVRAPRTGLSSRHRLSLLERVSAEAVTTTLHQVTRERMEDRCRGEYERSFLREFHKVRTAPPVLSLGVVDEGSGKPDPWF